MAYGAIDSGTSRSYSVPLVYDDDGKGNVDEVEGGGTSRSRNPIVRAQLPLIDKGEHGEQKEEGSRFNMFHYLIYALINVIIGKKNA